MMKMDSKFLAFAGFQLWEAAVFCLAFVAGMIALHSTGEIVLAAYDDPVFYVILAALTGLWNRLLHGFDLYLSRRLIQRSNEYFCLLLSVTIAAAFLALFGALLGQPTNQPGFLIWFMLVTIALIFPGRLFGRLMLRTARAHGRNLRFVAIAGAGREAQVLARQILNNPGMGFRLLGLFETDPLVNDLPDDLPKGGSIAALSSLLMRSPVDEVLIAMPVHSHFSQISEVLQLCQRTGVSARVVSDFLQNGPEEPTVERIGAQLCLHFRAAPDWGWQGSVKRVVDILGAGLGLLALSPLLLVVAAMIRIDSAGPALFSQTRVGKNRQHFRLYKFRTMAQDAEAQQAALEARNEAGGPVFKIKGDPRITRLGHTLRKYSIDELPQLLNVLRGDMSLVGPRPLPLRDVERFEQDWHSRRFSVRPGLTCSWVLHGRSNLAFDDWVQTDLDYIDNWSLLRDVHICLHTIPAVFKGAGAY